MKNKARLVRAGSKEASKVDSVSTTMRIALSE